MSAAPWPLLWCARRHRPERAHARFLPRASGLWVRAEANFLLHALAELVEQTGIEAKSLRVCELFAGVLAEADTQSHHLYDVGPFVPLLGAAVSENKPLELAVAGMNNPIIKRVVLPLAALLDRLRRQN